MKKVEVERNYVITVRLLPNNDVVISNTPTGNIQMQVNSFQQEYPVLILSREEAQQLGACLSEMGRILHPDLEF